MGIIGNSFDFSTLNFFTIGHGEHGLCNEKHVPSLLDFVSSTQTRVVGEEGTLIKELPVLSLACEQVCRAFPQLMIDVGESGLLWVVSFSRRMGLGCIHS